MALLNDTSDFRRRTWLVMERATGGGVVEIYRTAPAERRKRSRAPEAPRHKPAADIYRLVRFAPECPFIGQQHSHVLFGFAAE